MNEESKKIKNLTPAEWEQVAAIYEHGQDTIQGLSDKFGISTVAIQKGLKKRGVVKGSKAFVYAEAVSEVIRDNASEKAKLVSEFKNKLHDYNDAVLGLNMQELKKISDLPETMEKRKFMQLALKNTAEILKNVRAEKYALWDLNNEKLDDDKIPSIGISEYSSEDVDAIQLEQERLRSYRKSEFEEDSDSEGFQDE